MNTVLYSENAELIQYLQKKYPQLENALIISQFKSLIPYLESFKDEKFLTICAVLSEQQIINQLLISEIFRVLQVQGQFVILTQSQNNQITLQQMSACGFSRSQQSEYKQDLLEITFTKQPIIKSEPLKRVQAKQQPGNQDQQKKVQYQQLYGQFIYNPIVVVDQMQQQTEKKQSNEIKNDQKNTQNQTNPFERFIGKESQFEKIDEKLLLETKPVLYPEQLLSGGCSDSNRCANCPNRGKTCQGKQGNNGETCGQVSGCGMGGGCCGGGQCSQMKEKYKNMPKQELDQLLKNQQIQSSCGKCYLGDDQRCQNCPFRGLPSYVQQGNKIKLAQGQDEQLKGQQKQESQSQEVNIKNEKGKIKIDI